MDFSNATRRAILAVITLTALTTFTPSPASAVDRLIREPGARLSFGGRFLEYGSDESGPDYRMLDSVISSHPEITHIDFYGQAFDSLPHAISSLHNLVSLNIGANPMKTLPPWMGELKSLKKIIMSYCFQLDFVQAFQVLSQCPELQTLIIYANDFTTVPQGIELLSGLRELDLSYNNMDSLPPALSQLKQLVDVKLAADSSLNPQTTIDILATLPDLEKLTLTWCHFRYLPPSIGMMKNLKYLYLGFNSLDSIPSDICSLSNLEYLAVGGNRLTTLPPCIVNLTNLQVLLLGGIGLDTLKIQQIRRELPNCTVLR